MRSLTERMEAYEKKKARLADLESKLKLAEKKARVGRLVRLGEYVERAGLIDLSNEAIYGGILSLAQAVKDGKPIPAWTRAGAERIAEESQEDDGAEQAVVLTFARPVEREVMAALRSRGLRFNRVLRHWEGMVAADVAQSLADLHGASMEVVQR